MTVQIDGIVYYTAHEVTVALKITRQTLWRWRTEGKIPQGHRHRGHRILFSRDDLNEIIQYAHHIEPIGISRSAQLKLFDKAMGQ